MISISVVHNVSGQSVFMNVKKGSHQADEYEEHDETPAQASLAVDVSVSDGRHGDDQEVHALPVSQLVRIAESQGVPGIL